MYNDYYLEQINNKLATTNVKLENIIQNQEDIIEQQQISYSGDILRQEELIKSNLTLGIITMVIVITLIYHFIERCFRC